MQFCSFPKFFFPKLCYRWRNLQIAIKGTLLFEKKKSIGFRGNMAFFCHGCYVLAYVSSTGLISYKDRTRQIIGQVRYQYNLGDLYVVKNLQMAKAGSWAHKASSVKTMFGPLSFTHTDLTTTRQLQQKLILKFFSHFSLFKIYSFNSIYIYLLLNSKSI